MKRKSKDFCLVKYKYINILNHQSLLYEIPVIIIRDVMQGEFAYCSLYHIDELILLCRSAMCIKNEWLIH